MVVSYCACQERSKSWHWTTQCEAAFAALKDKLLSPPILSFAQSDKTFVVDTDASQDGLGAVLSQDGDRHLISYASRELTKAERQYCATRREILAVVCMGSPLLSCIIVSLYVQIAIPCRVSWIHKG